MFIAQVYSSGARDAFRLDSVVSLSITSSGSTVTVGLVDGKTISLAYSTNAEANTALDALLERLGWTAKPEGSA